MPLGTVSVQGCRRVVELDTVAPAPRTAFLNNMYKLARKRYIVLVHRGISNFW